MLTKVIINGLTKVEVLDCTEMSFECKQQSDGSIHLYYYTKNYAKEDMKNAIRLAKTIYDKSFKYKYSKANI